jgi:hypothetical protein
LKEEEMSMNALRRLVMGSLLVLAILCTGVSAQVPAAPSVQAVPVTETRPAYGPAATYYEPVTTYRLVAHDPSYQQTAAQAAQLAQQYARAEKEDEKKDLRKKLADVLAQQFDLHTKQQQQELDDLEKQIANLKATLKKRTDAKSAIVERRLEQITLEAEGLGWNAPGNPSVPQSQYHNFGFSPFPAPRPTPAPEKK